jgi:hypothetical protein
VSLQPNYEEPADSQLSDLQTGPDAGLWDAVVGVIEMVCEDTLDGTGRAHRLHGENGSEYWAVWVPHKDPDDLYVLWDDGTAPDGEPEAVFYYVGRLPRGLVQD